MSTATKTKAPPKSLLQWPAKPRVKVCNDFRVRVWISRCGRYQVRQSICLLGPQSGPEKLADSWLALRRDMGVNADGQGKAYWVLAGRHRKRTAAVKTCEAWARRAER